MTTAETAWTQAMKYENRHDPYRFFDELRKTPVVQVADKVYVVTGYRELLTLAHDPHISSDITQSPISATPVAPAASEPGADHMQAYGRQPSLIVSDPPRHDKARRQVMRHFGPPHSPDLIPNMESDIQQLCDDLLDGIKAKGQNTFDVVDDYAYPVPVAVICKVLGVPLKDEPTFHGWIFDFMAGADMGPDAATEEGRARAQKGKESIAALTEYMADLSGLPKEAGRRLAVQTGQRQGRAGRGAAERRHNSRPERLRRPARPSRPATWRARGPGPPKTRSGPSSSVITIPRSRSRSTASIRASSGRGAAPAMRRSSSSASCCTRSAAMAPGAFTTGSAPGFTGRPSRTLPSARHRHARASGDHQRRRVVLDYADRQPVGEVGADFEVAHNGVALDRTLEPVVAHVQRCHLGGLGLERRADLGGVVARQAADRDVLDLDQRGVAQPQQVGGREGGERRDGDHEAAPPVSGKPRQARRATEDARGGAHSKSSRASTSPRNWTSGSSVTPKRSCTRLRPSAIRATTSTVVASPVFSTKLACFSEKRAPPTASPRQPASSSRTPALARRRAGRPGS